MKKKQYRGALKKYINKYKDDESFGIEIIKRFENHQYEYELIDNNMQKPLVNCVSNYLLEHLKDQECVSLNSSLHEIAFFFGTSYRNLNRTLKELESNNIINCKGKKIYILDIEALKKMT